MVTHQYIRAILRNIYYKINDLNYRFELIKLVKKVNDVNFSSFEVLPYSIKDKLLHSILDNCRNGETLYDIGAYVGFYTLSFTAKYKNNKVVSFEPNPESFMNLLKNIRCNNFCDSIELYNIGLSNCEDVLPFYISSTKSRSSFNKFNAEYNNNYIVESKNISVKSLDSIIEELPKPDHIKIDAEGFELKILEGMKDTISKYQPIIYFEPHEISNNKRDNRNRDKNIKQFFSDMEYSISKIGYPCICKPHATSPKTRQPSEETKW